MRRVRRLRGWRRDAARGLAAQRHGRPRAHRAAAFRLGDHAILQRLHPIFRPEVNRDIHALTPLLQAAAVPVPSVVPTRDGRLWVELRDTHPDLDGVWRALTLLPGRTFTQITSPAQARAAGATLERFHRALLTSDHAFAFTRPGAHDTHRHMATLSQAQHDHPHHRLKDDLAPLADALRAQWEAWGDPPALPPRIIHGDPKISNFLFRDDHAVSGVVDLDTMAWSSVDVELGDALRSWCSTASESADRARFDLDIFEHALSGYLEQGRDWLTDAEIASLPAAAERICLELAARFAADTLHESYFRWDPDAAPSPGHHNLARTRNQLLLAQDIERKRPDLERRLQKILS